MLKLHKRMFGKVWNWAGHLRQKDKNIGVPFWQIEMDLKNLCDDVKAWIENESYFHDEMGVRFHHRLVSIHLFPNGNGRHARLMADLLIENVLGQPRFTWGGADLSTYLFYLSKPGTSEGHNSPFTIAVEAKYGRH